MTRRSRACSKGNYRNSNQLVGSLRIGVSNHEYDSIGARVVQKNEIRCLSRIKALHSGAIKLCLLLSFTHILVEPAEHLTGANPILAQTSPCKRHQTDLIVPFQRVTRLEHPVILIWEDHDSAWDAAAKDPRDLAHRVDGN
jgi:hypothetical protein